MPTTVAPQSTPLRKPARTGGPVLLLATQVFSTNGGVQAYMRRLLEVCDSYTRESQATYGCVALSNAEAAPPNLDRCRVYAAGSKTAYAACAIQASVRLQPRLVIAGHLGVAPVAILLKESGLAKSSAVVLHGIEAWRRCDWTDRFAARRADAVIATTRYTAAEFERFNGINAGKTRVVPLALGHSQLAPERPPANDRQVRVLTVSRLVSSDAYKGVDTLIAAMTLLRNHQPRVMLDIVGQGDDSDRLLQIARMGGVCDVVQFHGSVNDEELEQMYSRCDMFALPSRAEGFGIVFLEAMRHGKPCIGGNHGGTPEVIDHGVDGLLVEHGDAEALANGIARLASSSALRAEWGRNARRKVMTHYLFSAFESNWHRTLDSLISGS